MKAKIWGIPCFQALWLLSIAVLEGPGGWRMLDGNAIFQPVVINHDCRDALQEWWLLAPIRWISSKKISSSSSNSGNGYLLAGNYCLARDSVLRPTAAHSASLRVCPSGTYKRSCRECQWRRWTGEPPHQPRRSNGILFFFFFFIFIVFIFDVFISIIFIFLFFVLPQPSWSGSEWLQDLAKQSGSQALHSHLNQVLLKQQGIFILIYPVLIHVIKAMDIDRSPVQYATDSPLQANILMEMHAGTSNEVTSNVGKGTRLEEIKLDGITWTVSERTEIHKKRTNGCMRERERETERQREREGQGEMAKAQSVGLPSSCWRQEDQSWSLKLPDVLLSAPPLNLHLHHSPRKLDLSGAAGHSLQWLRWSTCDNLKVSTSVHRWNQVDYSN